MKQKIKDIFMSLGADVCGFANIADFSEAPKGFSPTDIYNDCKTVIVIGKALPKGLALIDPRLIYNHYNSLIVNELDKISLNAGVRIQREFDCITVPMPSDGPYEYWDTESLEGKGLLSVKHAAVLAGIGSLGKSTMLINENFGTLLAVGAVLTNLDLASDNRAKQLCLENCQTCIKYCPAGAISQSGVNQKLCREYTYGKNSRGFNTTSCNACRTKCPLVFGAV